MQDEKLPQGRRVPRHARRFTVHLDEPPCLLDEAVHLRCEHIPVVEKTHVDGLSAAFLGQKDLARLHVAPHGNGMGSFEVTHGPAEGFLQVMALVEVVFDHQRDGLGVGGDIGTRRDTPFPDGAAQHVVVVYITVEHRAYRPCTLSIERVLLHDGRNAVLLTGRDVHGVAVHRVAVDLVDGPHRCPAGMGEKGLGGTPVRQGLLEDGVFADVSPQLCGVLAEFTRHLGGLVGEGQDRSGKVDGPVHQVRGPAPCHERFQKPLLCQGMPQRLHRPCLLELHHHLQTCRVPPAHLESVEGIETRVDFLESAVITGVFVHHLAGQTEDPLVVPYDILSQRPGDVLERHQ